MGFATPSGDLEIRDLPSGRMVRVLPGKAETTSGRGGPSRPGELSVDGSTFGLFGTDSLQLTELESGEMRELGLFGLSIPTEYGGLGLSMEEEVLVCLELVAARTESAARRMAQRGDGVGGLDARVDQVLGECSDDPVAPREHLADALRVLAGGLDDPRRGGVDDGGDAARLGVERVSG